MDAAPSFPSAKIPQSLPAKLLTGAYYRAFQVALGELREEPRSLLLIGGARQTGIAQYLALLLPYTRIEVVDPDLERVEAAKRQIQCRLRFYHSPIEALPFEADRFDLAIAHNLFEFVENWEAVMAEIGRTTRRDFIFSTFRPRLWRAVQRIAGVSEVLEQNGFMPVDAAQPDWPTLWRHVHRYGKITYKCDPVPFHLYHAKMRPCREERLILS